MSDAEQLELILRVFRIFNGFRGPDSGELFWRTDGEYAPVRLYAKCHDLFHWATADVEEITAENIEILEEAARAMAALGDGEYHQANLLFCCRVRGMRPQRPYYKHLEKRWRPLFDACGPQRDE